MDTNSYSPRSATLAIVADQATAETRQAADWLAERDKTTVALQAAIKAGISIDELSSSTGLAPDDIRRRCERLNETV